jgi:crotonobetainyl-CoA:carnitine CoA-transferase CaiB-like acyl-CoA transferase
MRDPFVEKLSELRDSGAPYNELAALRLGQAPRFAGHRLYYGGYHTAAGAVVLGALTKQNRQAIRRVLDMHDTTDTPEYDNTDPGNPERLNHWRAEIQRKLLEKTAPEWVNIFLEAGVPASVVQMPEEMADDPQVEALGIMVDLEHAVTGPQRVVGPLLRMSATPTSVASAAPQLAADTADILAECGLSEAEIQALLAQRVVTQA